MTTAKQIRERAEAAQAAYEKGEAELYRPDGQKRYSGAEHAERLRELGAERRRACGEAAAAAQAEADTMRQRVVALENRDTSALLSVEELVAAGARKPFVDEEISALTSEALAARLDSVGGGNDRPGMYLHLQAAKRLAAQRRREGHGDMDLREPTQRLEKALFGDTAGRELDEARSGLQEMENASLLAQSLRTGARTAAGSYLNRKYGRAV